MEIKNYVEFSFESNPTYIMVDNQTFLIEITPDNVINPPENKEKIKNVVWDKLHPDQTRVLFTEPIDESGKSHIFFGEEKYNDWVKPYVDLWQAKKDQQEQEQQEAQEEYNKFENRQARALTQLNADFETVKERSHIVSSLGFTVDANQTANENVTGLLVTIGDTETVQFCDYHNQFHELTKAQLQTLQTEIITNAQNLYQQKWIYRTQIEQCSNNEQLDEVTVGIKFTYMDFTPTDEGDTGEQSQ